MEPSEKLSSIYSHKIFDKMSDTYWIKTVFLTNNFSKPRFSFVEDKFYPCHSSCKNINSKWMKQPKLLNYYGKIPCKLE